MQLDALAPYEHSLLTRAPLALRDRDGRTTRLDVERWLTEADAVDLDAVRDAVSPVLDVGCGPGRMVAALAGHGRFALGIDIAAAAVELAHAQGVMALQRSVFSHLPGEGRWSTVLLFDDNVGIGGDLDALLTRVRTLLTPEGRVIVECHPDADRDESHAVRFVLHDDAVGPEFPWCYAGFRAVDHAARRCGLTTTDVRHLAGRTFLTARPAQEG